ncbi:tetratricopeptide repeat protein, partial [Lentzea sp. NPDC058450]|uniref:tetratricopeptide repeat protein n=1 Tax=Lentzea sp. NPDC058450 TaxID=3346505 RepID=UPI00366146D6
MEVERSGSATASQGGVASSGVMGDVFTGDHYHYAASAQTPDWPVLVGHPPPLASAFQPRRELRDRVLAASGRGEDVVLTQRDSARAAGTQVLAGGGGVGKSQLAAWFARHALDNGTDLVVWVNASSPEQLTTAYGMAAQRVGVSGVDGSDAAGDASAFLQWLHTTDRTWLIVLDDVTDAAHLNGRWPPRRPDRWTLATTRLRQASLTGSGRHRVDIDTFTADESAAYLRDRLTGDDCAHLLDDAVPALAAALGHLPLALSHAAAYMLDQHETCAAYLARYTAGNEQLDELMPEGVDPDDYGRPVAVALLLALDAADAKKPVGLARPALALAAVLDPDGHPDDLWTVQAVADYLTAHRTSAADVPVTPQQVRAVLRTLHNYGLVVHTPNDGHQAVRIHALTARAARETTDFTPSAVRAAADALLQLWPANDHTATDLLTTLIGNTNTLAAIAGDLLWHPDGHALLYKAGISLMRCGHHTPAIKHWSEITAQALRILGEDHPDTVTARGNLAGSYWQAGRTSEAIEILEQVVADRLRLQGEDHPDTLTARGNLAGSYWQAGRTSEAIEIEEQVVADIQRLLGEDHPNTL